MRRKLRVYYWLLSGIVKRHKSILFFFILGAVILGISSSFLWKNIILSPFQKIYSRFDRQYYTEGMIGFPKLINPVFASSEVERDINELIFNSLFHVNSEGVVVPDLAESYRSDNNKEYTVFLKKNILWHDGKPFAAKDVVYTVKIAQDPSFKSPFMECAVQCSRTSSIWWNCVSMAC